MAYERNGNGEESEFSQLEEEEEVGGDRDDCDREIKAAEPPGCARGAGAEKEEGRGKTQAREKSAPEKESQEGGQNEEAREEIRQAR